jgi:hypothetical protein
LELTNPGNSDNKFKGATVGFEKCPQRRRPEWKEKTWRR